MSLAGIGDLVGSEVQDQANRANKNMNMANIVLQLMARGSTIDAATAKKLGLPASLVGTSAAVLPYYMGDIEKTAGLSAGAMTTAIQKLQGTPEYQGAQYREIFEKLRPAFEANTRTATDLATGATTEKMLAEAQPVFQARTDLATGRKNAALEQLATIMRKTDEIQARKGFMGDSSANQMTRFNASAGIARGASDDINSARLQNAMEKAGLQEQGRVLQRGNIGLSDTIAAAEVGRVGAPGRAMSAGFNTSLEPLKFFNLQPGKFASLEKTDAVPSTLDKFLGNADSAVNSALNYYLKNRGTTTPQTGSDGWNYGQSSGYGSYADTSGTYDPGPAVTSVDVP